MIELTVIIPFLNEGNEVENTLRSIRDTAENRVNILIINDCSTDEFDYGKVASRFSAGYHKNEERMGVAASRDLGVEMSTTPYFLLLDAHMRFYQMGWENRIVNELKTNNKSLLCCQTRVLHYKEGEIIEDTRRPTSYGAYIGITEMNNSLDAQWIWHKEDFDKGAENLIPCVLGAAYAAEKSYWQFLKGLSGLISYGSDEVYISLKVWLSGGRCKFLEDIEVGHIYRKEFPYQVETVHTTYNKMLIGETILPDIYKKQLFRKLRLGWKEVYGDAYALYYKNRDSINHLKMYYKQIFKEDFNFVVQLNLKKNLILLSEEEKEQLLKRIAYHVIMHSCSLSDIGLFNGKMACVLFLFHYSRYSKNVVIEEFAELLLDDICAELTTFLSIDMESGYCGIAWGLNYLIRQGFIEGDSNEVLEDIDKKIMERDPKWISDWTFDRGLTGILVYISTRLINSNGENFFDHEYMNRLLVKVEEVLSLPEITKTKDYDFLLEYSSYLKNRESLPKLFHLYDLVCLNIPQNNKPIESFPLNLDTGSVGMGLKLILEEERHKSLFL
jgi:glycosyltransferase involved in cell wall biosynthesis